MQLFNRSQERELQNTETGGGGGILILHAEVADLVWMAWSKCISLILVNCIFQILSYIFLWFCNLYFLSWKELRNKETGGCGGILRLSAEVADLGWMA